MSTYYDQDAPENHQNHHSASTDSYHGTASETLELSALMRDFVHGVQKLRTSSGRPEQFPVDVIQSLNRRDLQTLHNILSIATHHAILHNIQLYQDSEAIDRSGINTPIDSLTPGTLIEAAVIEPLFDESMSLTNSSRVPTAVGPAHAKRRPCIVIEVQDIIALVRACTTFGGRDLPPRGRSHQYVRAVRQGAVVQVSPGRPVIHIEGSGLRKPSCWLHVAREHRVALKTSPFDVTGRLIVADYAKLAAMMELRRDHTFCRHGAELQRGRRTITASWR